MNTGITIATIFSLLLALATAGGAAKHQAGESDSSSIRGVNLNHNETLVRDTALVQQSNDWSLWRIGESFAASLLTWRPKARVSFLNHQGAPASN